MRMHGDLRIDPYYWMKQRDTPEVLSYLDAENTYTEKILKPTEPLQEKLFQEMKARYKPDDTSLPYFFNGYWYTIDFISGKEYPLFYRQAGTLLAERELMLDVNVLAEGKEFFDLGSLATSPDNSLAAYGADIVSRRQYQIHIIRLDGQENRFEEIIHNTTGKVVWAADSKHFFYIRKDKSLRAFQIYRHEVGTDPLKDTLIFHETDETFDVDIYKTKSLDYIFIVSSSTLSDEHRYIPADKPHAEWKIIQPRTDGLEYGVEHHREWFYIITNADQASNFKVVKTPVNATGIENWQDVIPHREEILLEGFEIFSDYFVLEERNRGLLQINIINQITGDQHYLPFSDSTYTAYIGLNLEFNTPILRFGYTSMVQPSATFEYHMQTRETTLLREAEVLGDNFDKANYISQRIWAPARDGQKVAISLVYHRDTRLSVDTPLLLYGYGSYGSTIDASFSSVRLSLLNRGFIYAIAHIRGGEYLGREWYENGRMLLKKNTFYDFIDVALFLIKENYTSPAHLYAMGGSAGGLLMGAIMNLAPQLWNGIVAQVPFVDVVTTMLDESIPLTTGEYDEWGNPNDAEYYHYMKSYSPYDNIEAKAYPNLLVTTGYHDSQVQYWEPAKWVAKLRDLKTDHNLILFKIDMTSGHGGASGRFESLREDALEYAFLLTLENKIEE